MSFPRPSSKHSLAPSGRRWMLGRSQVTAAPARLPQQRGDLTAQLAAWMQFADHSQLVAQAPRTLPCEGRVIGQARAARGTDSGARALAFKVGAGGGTGLPTAEQ